MSERPMTDTERYSLVRHTMLPAFKTPDDQQAFETAVHDVSKAWAGDVQAVQGTMKTEKEIRQRISELEAMLASPDAETGRVIRIIETLRWCLGEADDEDMGVMGDLDRRQAGQ